MNERRSALVFAPLTCLALLMVAVGSAEAREPVFVWKIGEGQVDLLHGDQPIVRHMTTYDDSTAERWEATNKPFTHVFNTAGDDYITNGAGGRFPHHRGIFIGWNKLTHERGTFDLWHMRGNHRQTHESFEVLEANTNSAHSVAVVHWYAHGIDEPLIVEKRDMTFRRDAQTGELIIDFQSDLTASNGDIYLDGDPEHAGMHFRANNNLYEQTQAKTGEALYTFHADGVDPRTQRDLPWVTMSYTLGDQTYHVQYMNHPQNPENTVYSAYRDYGRFGTFFKHNIADGETLTLKYRLRITTGDRPSVDQMAEQFAAYADADGSTDEE